MPTRRKAPDPVAVRPPVPLMQPRLVPVLPAEDGMPGGVVYEIKVDGIRCCMVRTEAGVELWSRRGRPLHGRFPEVLPALAELLAPGVVLDGELCAYRGGRLAFTELLRSAGARAADRVAVSYVVWDVLAVPGRDVRGLPLVERHGLLAEVLTGARPPVERVMATRSRDTALGWYRDLHGSGVEGLVCKAAASPYRPESSSWVKVRHAETADVELAGVVGAPDRPEVVLARLPDGRQVTTSPRLTAVQARQVAQAVRGRLRPDSERAGVHWVAGPRPAAEVLLGSGRHGRVRFVRMRPPE
ncbi:DNA ligase [Kitasatospora sp. NPDC059146]|uniref:ATP-dependent DNA ligase n=1 Tax=unclassified Kitasatospora TaxID=2633591 RepID=UPI0036AB7ABA